MSSDTEAVSTDALLTDQQRIEKLEKAGKLNRLLIFGLAGALLLTLLAWLLVALLSSSAEEAAEDQAQLATLASVEALQKELGALQLQIAPLQQQIKDQQKLILLQAQQQTAAPTEAEAPVAVTDNREQDRENVRMVARTLIGQENNYQHTLNALKEGMRELAGMTPGSRSWLDFYEESLAKPMADSQARVKALQKWSGEQTK
ncbi:MULTISPECIES: hypothetical protein [unclassified Pseudomonas]|uniref:hypothetical protein n=1 Tax=unclassified Pseudomonas TaxID=196821 RepID=UPI00244CCF5E|nr:MULTISPECIES: hypothetical protein [unclassified Pseudomonas]MDG9926226.1 hypothetical protein [Pseudomonas sp. GD04045]MDH0037331.1 hypothetical protein [Pseudomonas sp. GD04019]